jgi:hypothetical protein
MLFGTYRNFKARVMLALIVAPLVLLYWGLSELAVCTRVLFGPTTASYAEASSKGLAGYGYIRVTGVQFEPQRGVVIRRRNLATREDGPWEGVYVPVAPGADAQASGRGRLLAFLCDAREPGDVAAVADEEGLVGFVDNVFTRINPGHQTIVKNLAGAAPSACWVVDVRRPSWLKGLGFTLGSLVIPGLFAAWKIRNPGLD